MKAGKNHPNSFVTEMSKNKEMPHPNIEIMPSLTPVNNCKLLFLIKFFRLTDITIIPIIISKIANNLLILRTSLKKIMLKIIAQTEAPVNQGYQNY